MERMVENGDLEMITNKIDKFNQLNEQQLQGHKIPYDIVFLALAESGRKANAQSSVARGQWQFTSSSAEIF
ncbi:MAG: hypothetical protein LBD75_03630 [Candidatus Peribacteria bacterium]|jgi:hypothetical protein|nr:hypothetical protein [Candidatus Peribacteria bacterium]